MMWPDKSRRRRAKGPTAKARATKATRDARYASSVRKIVADRDGACRIGDWENNPEDIHCDSVTGEGGWPGLPCGGLSEWAHLGDKKRFKTRGLPPEERHTPAGSLMLCAQHHDDYDEGRLQIIGGDAELALEFRVRPEVE